MTRQVGHVTVFVNRKRIQQEKRFFCQTTGNWQSWLLYL